MGVIPEQPPRPTKQPKECEFCAAVCLCEYLTPDISPGVVFYFWVVHFEISAPLEVCRCAFFLKFLNALALLFCGGFRLPPAVSASGVPPSPREDTESHFVVTICGLCVWLCVVSPFLFLESALLMPLAAV
eukprot:RCo054753